MDKIRLDIVGLSASQAQSGSFALVLAEAEKQRRLPIIIGMFEAQAIAIEMEKISSSRPMTHDLFKNFAENFEFHIEQIIISDLREGVFYAEILCKDERSGQRSRIDARPSDAIAIGLRFGAPIYTNERIMKEAGISLKDIQEESTGRVRAEIISRDEEAEPSESTTSFANLSPERLEALLEKAINEEDYERAAKIRDELNRRNS
ncbi:MAG: bifunctional nuclease family protein [Bernardetiaceae bacterium]|nr:bifunctional nuclease family protein [Bernardetiaceae bacterium]